MTVSTNLYRVPAQKLRQWGEYCPAKPFNPRVVLQNHISPAFTHCVLRFMHYAPPVVLQKTPFPAFTHYVLRITHYAPRVPLRSPTIQDKA
jgi:hypothetical protein